MTPAQHGFQRVFEDQLQVDSLGLDHGENDLHHSHLEQAGGMAKSGVVENDV